MVANTTGGQQLLRYWLTSDLVLVEWQDEHGGIERSTYTTAEHRCTGMQPDKTYFDLERVDGERAKDLEDDIFDILTRYESARIAKLHAGAIADAPSHYHSGCSDEANRHWVFCHCGWRAQFLTTKHANDLLAQHVAEAA